MSIIAILGLILLYRVVFIRRFWDQFAIGIPLVVTCYGIMTLLLYMESSFNDIDAHGKDVHSSAIRVTYWYYAALYGAYHWLCAVSYFISSLTLQTIHREAVLLKKQVDLSRPQT